jgi:zinc protease
MNYRYISLIITILFSVTGISQELEQAPNLIKRQLGNGLTYYIYPNDHPENEAVFRLFIKSGSVFEEEDQQGLAHFLEHMAFNGTENFPGNSLIKFLESKGAKFGVDFNAHTSLNETVYKLSMSLSQPGMLDSTLLVLSDIAGGLTLDSMAIEDERGVIVSEWLAQTGPKREAREAFLMELLNDSRYSKRLTIGDTAIIKNFPHQRLRDYYEQWYSPSVMAIAVVGDVDVQKTEQLIKKRFSHLKQTIQGAPHVFKIPDYSEEVVTKVSHESLDKVEFNIIQLTDMPQAVKREEDYLFYLRRQILNDLISERFSALSFHNLPYKGGSYSYGGFLNIKGALMGSAELIPGKIYEGMRHYFLDVEQMFRYGFVPVEIEKIKTKYITNLRDKAKSKSPKASGAFMDEIYSEFFIGHKFVTIEHEYELAKKYIDEIDSLSLVKQLHEIRDTRETHYLLSFFDKVEGEIPTEDEILSLADSVQSADITPYDLAYEIPDNLLENKPKKGEIVKIENVKGLEAKRIILDNGVEVIYKYSELDNNRVILSGFREGGLYALDSSDYVNGLVAGRLATLSGVGPFSREALNHYQADKTVSLLFLIEKTRSGIVGNSDHKDIEELFKLFYLKWTQPRADSAVFEQMKEKTIEKYLTSNKTATDTFYQDLGIILNGENYTRRELSDSILNHELDYDRMLPVFHQNFGNADGYKFVIIGDYPFKKIKSLVVRYIGGLPSGDVNSTYNYTGSVIPETPVTFERSVGDNPKSVVSLVFQSHDLSEDLNRYKIKAEMLKSVLRTRLLQTLREEMGKVYSVGVSVGATMHPSILKRSTIRFSCNPIDVDTLIDRTMQEINKLVQNPDKISTILKDVKLNMVKKWQADQQKNLYWSRSIRNSLFNNEKGWDSILNYDSIVNSITTEDISAELRQSFIEPPMIKAILNPKPNSEN